MEYEGEGENAVHSMHREIQSEDRLSKYIVIFRKHLTFLMNPRKTSLRSTSSASLHKPSVSYVLKHSVKSVSNLLLSTSNTFVSLVSADNVELKK